MAARTDTYVLTNSSVYTLDNRTVVDIRLRPHDEYLYIVQQNLVGISADAA